MIEIPEFNPALWITVTSWLGLIVMFLFGFNCNKK